MQRLQARFVAEERREAERAERADRQARRLAEQEEAAARVASLQATAASRSQEVANRCAALRSILVEGLRRRAEVNFARMRRAIETGAPVPPAELATPGAEPLWVNFAPAEPGAVSRLLGGAARHAERVATAQRRFEQATRAHRERERDRLDRLATWQRTAQERFAAKRRECDVHNARVAALQHGFESGEQEAVERCLRSTLETEVLPADVAAAIEVGYRRESRQVLVLRDLPDTDIVPTDASYRYVKSRDAVEAVARKPAELRSLYAELIAQLAVLTLRDVFAATTGGQVGEVMVNCMLPTIDRATGQPIRPCLLTVSATRAEFEKLVLDRLEPVQCLRHLNALMSPHPYDVEAVKPLFEPDLSRFRLVDAQRVAATMDARTVLVQMSPTEFEHLVRELFESMGMQSWVTQASRDDGVDAIAFNPDKVMGGLCVIQAKRYMNVVPAEAVRALWGVMEDKKAGTGVLVTTSYFGKATHDFAKRNPRVRLIEGPELKHLIKEYLGLDVIPGAKVPRRRA